MNPKRIIIALIAAFVALSATDFLIHQVLLKSTYAPDVGKLWRKDIPMSGIMVSELLLAIAFTMLWVRIALGGAAIQCAIALGVFMGLAQSSYCIMHGAVEVLPDGLVTKWIACAMVQSVLVGLVLFFVHQPTKPCPDMCGK
jgi:hypothetical protein